MTYLKSIVLGQYLPGQSILHRADPRVKLTLTTIVTVLLFCINSYQEFTAFIVFTALVLWVSRIPPDYAVRAVKPMAFIIIFSALVNIFTIPGRPVSGLFILRNITYEGIDISLKLSIRLSLLCICFSIINFTTTPVAMTDGIEKLFDPLKKLRFPVHEIAMMMSIALRFIPTIMDETERIIKAQASRGADFDSGNIIKRAKSFIPVLVPLFVSAFRRADELAVAMEARCYRGSEGRTRMKQLRLTNADLYASITTVFFVVLIILIGIIIKK